MRKKRFNLAPLTEQFTPEEIAALKEVKEFALERFSKGGMTCIRCGNRMRSLNRCATRVECPVCGSDRGVFHKGLCEYLHDIITYTREGML
jgi:hypothetical protein